MPFAVSTPDRGRRGNHPAPQLPRTNIVAIIVFIVPAVAGIIGTSRTENPLWFAIGVVSGLILAQAPKIARQWERAVILRLGKFIGLRGPGIFWIIPFIDTVT